MPGERLTRDVDNAMLGGVLAGLGRQYHVDPTLLRVAAVVLSIPTGGITIPAYLAAWLIIPRPDQVESGASRASVPSRAETMDDLGQTARRASERLAEAARIASEAARTAAEAARAAAEEVADLAHRPRPEAGSPQAGGPATSQTAATSTEGAPSSVESMGSESPPPPAPEDRQPPPSPPPPPPPPRSQPPAGTSSAYAPPSEPTGGEPGPTGPTSWGSAERAEGQREGATDPSTDPERREPPPA